MREEKSTNNYEDNYFNDVIKLSSFKTILFYYITYLFCSLLIGFILSLIFVRITNYDNKVISSALLNPSLFSLEEVKLSALYNTLHNFIVYLIMLIGILFLCRKFIIDDFTKLVSRKKFYIIYSIVGIIIFVSVMVLIDRIINLLKIDDSANQKMIENMLRYGPNILIAFSTIIFAPIVEEIVFRKCIFDLFGKKVWIAYLVSILLFSLPHMMSTNNIEIYKWFLLFLSYAVAGLMLCVLYHKSNKNVLVCIAAHMINNLISYILVVTSL